MRLPTTDSVAGGAGRVQGQRSGTLVRGGARLRASPVWITRGGRVDNLAGHGDNYAARRIARCSAAWIVVCPASSFAICSLATSCTSGGASRSPVAV